MWERRIARIATFHFIRENKFDDAMSISKILMNDKHNLIQKAIGWMLREVGKRDRGAGERFLLKHYKKMPRTMLRYAIERFDESKRRFYMNKQAIISSYFLPQHIVSRPIFCFFIYFLLFFYLLQKLFHMAFRLYFVEN